RLKAERRRGGGDRLVERPRDGAQPRAVRARRRAGPVRPRAGTVPLRPEGRDRARPREGRLVGERRRPLRDQRGLQRHRVRSPRARHPRGEAERQWRRSCAWPPDRRIRYASPRDPALRPSGARQESRCRVPLPRRRRGRRPRGGDRVVKVGVVGAGTMGHGIAQTFATAGYDVTLVDVNREQVERAVTKIKFSLDLLEKKGKLPGAARDIAARITTANDI